MDELRIDEALLHQCHYLLTYNKNFQHKGLRNIIEMIAMAGYRHRSEYKIVLFQDDIEAEYDEDYAAYLDKKACSEDVSDSPFNPIIPTVIKELGMDDE
jgi:hypothetical protein|tara:strand:- start:656 stop:952 length:297 start_codon:yes stop_codon:yes gene_type:complete